MRCESCGQDRPLTYHQPLLGIRAICGPCIHEKYPWSTGPDPNLVPAIAQALMWLKKHPHRDYLDAAFAVVADPKRSAEGSVFSTTRWGEYVSAVKSAVQNLAAVS